MINKQYWDNFYKENILTNKESNFSNYVYKYIKENNIKGNLVDIACGNGRDSIFFSSKGINTTGVDLSFNIDNPKFIFKKENILEFDYSEFNVFYMRFIVHALKEEDLDNLINKIIKISGYYFIETRSSKGITNEDKSETFFKSSIGEKHFRMLYSKKYLDKKISKNFEILESTEGKFSEFGNDNPYCIRYILRK